MRSVMKLPPLVQTGSFQDSNPDLIIYFLPILISRRHLVLSYYISYYLIISTRFMLLQGTTEWPNLSLPRVCC